MRGYPARNENNFFMAGLFSCNGTGNTDSVEDTFKIFTAAFQRLAKNEKADDHSKAEQAPASFFKVSLCEIAVAPTAK